MNYIAPHKFLEKATDKTLSILNSPLSERLIFICGPSGVGKKELIEELKTRITYISKPQYIKTRDNTPVISVEAIPPEQGGFNFKNLWKQALANSNEPLLDSKISYSTESRINSEGQSFDYSKTKAADFHEVLINALTCRNVTAMIINEAHHLLRLSSGKKINESIDLLKSLTNNSPTRIILVGTYALCMFLEDLDYTITDQINQRTRVIEFPRYHRNKPDEINEFGKTAKKLLIHMPFEKTAENLVDTDWEYFYKYSLGCIGTLKNWLTDAYSLALDSQAEILTKEHLEETKISGNRLSFMFDSILDGEKRMANILSEGDLDAKLMSEITKALPNESVKKNTNCKNPKPFERSPKRDTVMLR